MTKALKVVSNFEPAGSQPGAIKSLVSGLEDGLLHQTLLGVTGSGKTYTMAKVIEETPHHLCIEECRKERGDCFGPGSLWEQYLVPKDRSLFESVFCFQDLCPFEGVSFFGEAECFGDITRCFLRFLHHRPAPRICLIVAVRKVRKFLLVCSLDPPHPLAPRLGRTLQKTDAAVGLFPVTVLPTT